MVRKNRGPSRPSVPSRIHVDASPLVTQVAEMMELAKPIRGLSQSLLLRRAASSAALQTGQREVLGRKRGRKHNPVNTPLELAYLPPGVVGGLKQKPSKKRVLFARDGKGIIEHAKNVLARGQRKPDECNGRPISGSRSEEGASTLEWECSCILRARSNISCCSSTCSSSSTVQSVQDPSALHNACEAAPATPTDAPLPGINYITYPATPDLASSCPSLHAPEDFPFDDEENGGSRRGRVSRSENSSRSHSRSIGRSGGGGGDGNDGDSGSSSRGGGRAMEGNGGGRSRSADGGCRISGGGDRPALRRRRPSCPFIDSGRNGQSRDESERPNHPFIGGADGQSRTASRATGSGFSSISMGGGDGDGSDGDGVGGGRGGCAATGSRNQEQDWPEGEKEGGQDWINLPEREPGLSKNDREALSGEQRAAESPPFENITSPGRESSQRNGAECYAPSAGEPSWQSPSAKTGRRGKGKGTGRGRGVGRRGDMADVHPFELKVLPSLPGVDDHQLPSFCLAELHGHIRRNRAAMKTPFRDRAIRRRRAAPALKDEANVFDEQGFEGGSCMNTEDEKELSAGVRYLLAFKAKAGRDGITLQELESAFRASRRADAFMAIEKKGKAAFVRCLAMLKAHGLSPHAWIDELLSKRKGDSLTTFDMGESIRAYNRAKPSCVRSHKHWLRDFMISEKDLRWCLRFVDPDGNTDVDAEELSNAVRSTLEGKPRIPWEEGRAVALILEFDRFMSVNHIRLVDLFEKADKDKGGTVDEEQLREFLKLVKKAAGGEEGIQAKERKEKPEAQEKEKAREELKQKATKAKERLAHARETGAYDVLCTLKNFTKTKGLRLSDLMKATGAHPDEGMTPAQLEAFFERTTNSPGQLTKSSLERIVVFVDEDGDGLLSLHEIQLALAQQTHDELLLRQLAKAVARCMAKKERESNASQSQRKPDTASVNDRRGFGGGGVTPTGISRTTGRSDPRNTLRNDPRNDPRNHTTRNATRNDSRNDARNDPRNDTWNGSRNGLETTASGRSVRWDNFDGSSSEAPLDGTVSSGATPGSLGGRTKKMASSTCGSSSDGPETSAVVSGGASTNAEDNYLWILDDDSSIDSIALMEGLNVAASMGDTRGAFRSESSVPRTAFRVQAGSNLDSSWLPGFDQRFEIQRRRQGQRVVGGSCTWYTN